MFTSQKRAAKADAARSQQNSQNRISSEGCIWQMTTLKARAEWV
ncbi:MAG: hypothetical protein WBM44_20610 [Waterburya sp.]